MGEERFERCAAGSSGPSRWCLMPGGRADPGGKEMGAIGSFSRSREPMMALERGQKGQTPLVGVVEAVRSLREADQLGKLRTRGRGGQRWDQQIGSPARECVELSGGLAAVCDRTLSVA